MAAYKDTHGSWRYRKSLRLPAGLSERISGTPAINTRREAEEAERKHIERILHPERFAPERECPAPGFASFAKIWLDTYPPATNKASTVASRTLHVTAHLIPHWAETPLDQISNLALTGFVAYLRTKRTRAGQGEGTLSPQTIASILSTLHRLLSCAVEWGNLKTLPRFPKVKVPKAEWDWLTREETARLLATVTDLEDRALLLFALRTGARVGEQLALQWDAVDFNAGTVRIERAIHRGWLGDTKTGKERTVPMGQSLAGALREIRHLRGPLVFSDAAGRPQKIDDLRGVLSRYLRTAGLRDIRWHDLRHTFASSLAAAGIPLKQLQDWLGHATIAMTMRYSHLCPDQGARLIGVLDAA